MNQRELIELMEQWQNTEPKLYKANIKCIADIKGIKPRHIESALNVPNSTAKSYTNVGHLARIEFLTALKLAELLEVDIKKLLEEIDENIKSPNNLLVYNPDLCKEWNYKINKDKPEDHTYGTNEKVWWICSKCNHEWLASIGQRNKGSGCPICNESKGEKRILAWLIKNNILFEPQKEFYGLKGINNGNLSYDFYLPDYNLLIEYQGEFHDGIRRGFTKINLNNQQEHDRRKREYASLNNVDLLEIWYWDFDKVEEILDNLIER